MQLKQIAAVTALLLSSAAQADTTVYSNDFSSAAFITTNQTITTSFNAAAGAGMANFQIRGYSSLDGDNYYIDIFKLSVNGNEVFSGTWNLGGGGADRVFQAPSGASVSHVGQMVTISLPVTLLAGANSISYSYESPNFFEGSGRAGYQGLGDEGWHLGQVQVTSAVPEADTWAMLLAGVGALGFFARRRKQQA